MLIGERTDVYSAASACVSIRLAYVVVAVAFEVVLSHGRPRLVARRHVRISTLYIFLRVSERLSQHELIQFES